MTIKQFFLLLGIIALLVSGIVLHLSLRRIDHLKRHTDAFDDH